MLLEAVLSLFMAVIRGGLALFPTWEPTISSPAWSALSAANVVIPLDVWLMLSGLTVSAMLAGLIVWSIKMGLNFIRGSGA